MMINVTNDAWIQIETTGFRAWFKHPSPKIRKGSWFRLNPHSETRKNPG